MSWFTTALSGPIGRKLLMAVTGLFLITFLLEHLLSNFLLLSSTGELFNGYAEFMGSNIFIKAAEYVLFAGFIVHITYAAIITYQNKKARPKGYSYNNPSENSTWFSRNMGLTGLVVLAFLLLHLQSFFFPHKLPQLSVTGEAHTDLYTDAYAKFASIPYTAFYVFAMLLLCFHLMHGFQSSFQTLGARHPKYTPLIKGLGTGFAILVPLGFALIPLIICIKQL
jgi:succinate dehydrogenase / fumarate reductase, cytochrome b subunit